MSKSEERRKVVVASYSFFKSAEQVSIFIPLGKTSEKTRASATRIFPRGKKEK